MKSKTVNLSTLIFTASMLAGCTAHAPQITTSHNKNTKPATSYQPKPEAPKPVDTAEQACPLEHQAHLSGGGIVCSPRLAADQSTAKELAFAAACGYLTFQPRYLEFSFDDTLQAFADHERKLLNENAVQEIIRTGKTAFGGVDLSTCPKTQSEFRWANSEAARIGEILAEKDAKLIAEARAQGLQWPRDLNSDIRDMLRTIERAADTCESAFKRNAKEGIYRTWCAQPDIPQREWSTLVRFGAEPIPRFIQRGANPSLRVEEVSVPEEASCTIDSKAQKAECPKGVGSLKVSAFIPENVISESHLGSDTKGPGPIYGEVRPFSWENVRMQCPWGSVMDQKAERGRKFFACVTLQPDKVEVRADITPPPERIATNSRRTINLGHLNVMAPTLVPFKLQILTPNSKNR